MKIAAYSARPDELEFFLGCKIDGVEIVMIDADPTLETAHLAKGCDCVSIVQKTVIGKEMLDLFKELGIKFLSSRTVGIEHVDTAYAKKIGIGTANISYTPYSVAEYAVMMMLMSVRNIKTILTRAYGQDYSLSAVTRGRLISDCTVGIVGTGQIGGTVAKLLSGFGCKILACDIWQNPALAGLVEYVSLDELLANCDVVSLHTPSTKESFHLFGEENLAKMKKGAILINTARGEIVETEALISALESGHLGGAGIDVVEDDRLIYYRDKKGEQLNNRNMTILNGLPNVIMAPHMAFFTDHSVRNMVENSIKSCKEHIDSL